MRRVGRDTCRQGRRRDHRLKAVWFFGIEVSKEYFVYVEGGPDSKRLEVLARKYADRAKAEPRYSIHPAYRMYLEINSL